ncbi:TetR/AcrR family transcriptional regulator [Liquorilactobacillus capillatus]|uniref:Transcription regulator n=1 Tax=Liquorilactobacillus capillatus DSM 19910 TaxID=1423731 RepID=A0A0R1MBA3_9LACO|nr:TetR/AcrR family transcriptional regulator [Liquorilactobacillus capillatus]KRL02186.1 transcription regulator [Liquorilactobacillus capillatus DSM 19910]
MAGKKNNRRTLYTKHVIRRSFLELLQSEKLEKITVTEICQKADINRGTFYRYYQNPLDLMRYLQDEVYQKCMCLLKQRFNEGSCGILKVIFTVLKETDPEIVRTIMDKQNGRAFLEEVFAGAKEATRPFTMQQIKWLTDVQFDYFYAYITNGSIGIISQWVRSGMEHNTKKIEKMVTIMVEESKQCMEDKGAEFSQIN